VGGHGEKTTPRESGVLRQILTTDVTWQVRACILLAIAHGVPINSASLFLNLRAAVPAGLMISTSPFMSAIVTYSHLFAPYTQTSQFTVATVEAVQQTLSEKNSKAYLTCLVRRKAVMAKPEEIVRQLWLHTLHTNYHYPYSQMQVEYPVTFGRDTSKRADIVIMDPDRETVPYIIIEVKQGEMKDGKEQLRSYTHATGAPLAVWSDGIKFIVWHRKDPNYFEVVPGLPTAHQDLEAIVGQPWTIDKLLEFEKERESQSTKAVSLRQLIQDLENEVLANAGVDVFEEVFKLIFTKLFDEMSCFSGEYEHLRFRNFTTAAKTKSAIQSLFDDARAKWDGVFDDEKIRLTPDHLRVCVGSLEQWKLFNSNLDVVDEAFEYLVNKSAKGEKGQYFTPRWVIDMCVKMLNPKESESIIDTACGSAGFTVHSIFHVWRAIFDDMGKPASHLFTMEKKPPRCTKYVQDKVFAIDFDEKSVRVSRCLNLIAGDGQTNVLHLNTLNYKRWDETTTQEDWTDIYHEGWKKLRKLMAQKKDYRSFEFDVLMANPPFAGDIKQSDMLSPYELAHKLTKEGNLGKLETSVGRDLLFIERNLDFLKPGGRMAVVLPQGRFNNSSDQRVREYIATHGRILAVVGIHGNTFKPHTGTKTSVLFVQKWTKEEKAERDTIIAQREEDWKAHCTQMQHSDPNARHLSEERRIFCASHHSAQSLDYPIFFATQQLPSKDNSGDKIYVKADYYAAYDPKTKNRRWLHERDYLKEYGSMDGAELYSVLRPNASVAVEMLLSAIDAEWGSKDAAKAAGCKFIRLNEKLSRLEPLRDDHHHYVVQHDLFNHDGLTKDGITEAFIEFASKEKLSFF
jgi:type I restriction enzyme M protein